MSSSAIKAGEAFIEFFARDDTKKTFDQVGSRMRRFGAMVGGMGAGLTAAGGAILGAIAPAIATFADFGGGIVDSMARTSLSSELLQSLSFSAEQAGGSLWDVEAAARTMNKTIAAAAAGNKSAVKNLAQLGLTAEQLLALSPDDRFKAIASGVAAIDDPALRSAAAMKVLGKSASNIMEILSGGAAEINRTTAELQGAGLIFSEQDIQNADALGDAWGQLTATLGRAYQLIGAALAPTLTDLIGIAQDWVTWLTQVADANREWIVLLAKVAAAAVAVGGILTAVGATIVGIGMVVSAIPAIVAAVSTAIGFMSAAFAAIVSPIGLTIAGIAGLLALLPVLAYMLDADLFQGAGLRTIIALFGEMWSIGATAIQGIFDAIATGNWGLAGSIAMQALYAAFSVGWGWLKIGFNDVVTEIWKLFIDLFGSNLIGIVTGGIRRIMELINEGAKALGLGDVVSTKGILALEQSAKSGNLKRDLDAGNRAIRKSIENDIAAAKGGLEALAKIAADEKEKRFAPKAKDGPTVDPTQLQKPVDTLAQTQSWGASNSAAVARMANNKPEFSKLGDKLDKSNEYLKTIAENTEDLEDEGLSD